MGPAFLTVLSTASAGQLHTTLDETAPLPLAVPETVVCPWRAAKLPELVARATAVCMFRSPRRGRLCDVSTAEWRFIEFELEDNTVFGEGRRIDRASFKFRSHPPIQPT